MFRFRFLAFVAARVGFAEDRRERLGEAWAELFVVGDVEARVERLVREPPVGISRPRVRMVRVGEQPQRVVQERPSSGVALVVLRETPVHVREAGSDAVLVSLEGGQVDGVGEVRGEEFVAFSFQPGPVRRQLGDLLVLAGVAFVERGIDVGREAPVIVFADRDAPVGVCDEPFGNLDGYRAPGAGGFLGGAAGADEVGVGGAAGVGGEVQQHAGAAGAAVQQPFEVVRVLDVTGCAGVAGVEERLHLVEQLGFD